MTEPQSAAIRDYLNEKAREVDHKYDFRYSVLIGVFARLMAEGWLTPEDLADLELQSGNSFSSVVRDGSTSTSLTFNAPRSPDE